MFGDFPFRINPFRIKLKLVPFRINKGGPLHRNFGIKNYQHFSCLFFAIKTSWDGNRDRGRVTDKNRVLNRVMNRKYNFIRNGFIRNGM